MNAQNRTSSRETIAIGAIAAAAGVYFILVGLGVLPVPGGRRALHAPLWIAVCAGLAFLFAGLAVTIRGVAGMSDTDNELPAAMPGWAQAAYHVIGIAAVASLASVGTWIAFGAGARQFSLSTPFFHTASAGEMIGRIAFGIGAIITWLYVAALTVRSARRLIGRDKTP